VNRCEHRWTAGDPVCGHEARYLVSRGRKYDAQYSCRRHLSATAEALAGQERREVTVQILDNLLKGPEMDALEMRAVVGDDYYGYRLIVPREYTNSIVATADEKWAVLASIGVERRDDVTPLVAWRDACADEMDVPRAELDPAQGGRLDLGFSSMYVRKFVMFLA
jgi:hypothetical protein